MADQFKEVAIGERRYRVGKMTALIASRVHNWILSGSARLAEEEARNGSASGEREADPRSPEERANGVVTGIWVMASALYTEELIEKVQMHCLRACAVYPDSSDAPPTPIMMTDGRWADRTLDDDPVTVNQLVLESLRFNVAPFFIANISKPALGL